MKPVRDIQHKAATSITSLEAIKQEIHDTHKKLSNIDTDIYNTTLLIDSIKDKNTHLIKEYALHSNRKKPRAIATQQSLLQQQVFKLQGLNMAKYELESKITELKQQQSLSLIYQEISLYSKHANIYYDETNKVFCAIREANRVLEQLHKTIQEYLFISPEHLEYLNTMIHKLNGVSYSAFLNGEILECDSNINASFIADVSHTIQKLSNGIPQLGDLTRDMQQLQSKLLLISRHAESLVPRSAKYVESVPVQKAIPINRERPPKEFIEIQGRPFRYDAALERYVPINPVSKPEEAPAWGVISA